MGIDGQVERLGVESNFSFKRCYVACLVGGNQLDCVLTVFEIVDDDFKLAGFIDFYRFAVGCELGTRFGSA